ncbi:hypothetical protein QAD02_012150 [Eretmocerus hayati]|uniref:Uncharacterized protein n=1 Tax=Eretmocerus hayati TaxID=131215 RepID=A0ACC2NZT8_9HYME|nr:hypothetical protein QAD02_012150 [Eretmocerus hayati]
MKDFHGYPVTVDVFCSQEGCEFYDESHPSLGIDLFFLESLVKSMNCRFRVVYLPWKALSDLSLEEKYVMNRDIFLPFRRVEDMFLSNLGVNFKSSWLRNNIIPLPVPHAAHFYLLQPKTYDEEISPSAIIAFFGLFFTAFIFAVWAQFLGFEERNWTFLNILTAQMGGNIEYQGTMRLSKVTFQMSIYIATFIVVTLGTDYMFQIFVFRGKLSEIETLKDLVQSDMNFIMDVGSYDLFENYQKDFILQKIFNRTQSRLPGEGYHSFCNLPADLTSSVLDETMNLCIEKSGWDKTVMRSNSWFRVTRIKGALFETTSFLYLEKEFSFFKNRLAESINRFAEVGLLKLWREGYAKIRMKKFSHNSIIPLEDGNQIPLHHQLWPIIAVGTFLSFIALIGELIWKRWIERTEFGAIVKRYYNESRSGSTRHSIRLRHRGINLR